MTTPAEDARREAETGWQPRDLDAKPYTADEKRVCEYLRLITNDQIGCGDDPVSFLIASHNYQNRLLKDERAKSEGLRAVLEKINVIRNSIIGMQKFNWSEHVYPLVAALNEAGIEGMEYPEAREYFGSLIDRAVKAEDALAALSASPSPTPRPPSD